MVKQIRTQEMLRDLRDFCTLTRWCTSPKIMAAARLISIHLHDNDGAADQQMIPFSGTVDWDRLVRIIAASAYKKCISMETTMMSYKDQQEEDWLKEAYLAGAKLEKMLEDLRNE